MKSLLLSVTAAIALIAAPINKGDAAPISVDVELQMLVDVSGSVDSNEFNLQRDGYVSAFRSASIQNAILNKSNGRLGKIAAELIGDENEAPDQTVVTGSVPPAEVGSAPAKN